MLLKNSTWSKNVFKLLMHQPAFEIFKKEYRSGYEEFWIPSLNLLCAPGA